MRFSLSAFLLLAAILGAAQPVTRLWIKTTSRAGTDSFDDLAIDSQRNVYVCGSSINTVNSKYEILVAKFDKAGVKLWEKFIPATSGHATGRAIVIDPSGNPIVAAQTDWNPPSDGKSRILKLAAANGAILYDTVGTQDSQWYAVAVDNTGEATATGYGGTGASRMLRTTHFLATGGVAWNRDYAYPGITVVDQAGRYVTVDSNNDIYVCGVNNAFPTTTKNTLLKFSRAGAILWSRHFANAKGFDYPRGFGLGPNETPTMCLESRISNNSTSDGATVVRYDANGNQVNKRTYGGGYDGFSVRAFDVDLDGNYFVGGVQTYQTFTSPFYVNLDAGGGTYSYGLAPDKEVRAIRAAPHRGEYFVGLNVTGSGPRPTTIQAMSISRDYTNIYYPTYSWNQMLFGSTAQSQVPYFLVSGMKMDSMGDLYAIAIATGSQAQDAFVVKYELGPLARDDEFKAQTGTLFNTIGEGASSNDNQIRQASAGVVSQPTHGNVTFQTNGTFSYMPDAGFAGQDTFVYRQSRTNSTVPRSSDATVRMVVMPNLTATIVDPPEVYGGGNAVLIVSVSPTPNHDLNLTVLVSPTSSISSYPGITVRSGNSLAGGSIVTRNVTVQEVVTFTVKSGTSTRTATLTIKPF